MKRKIIIGIMCALMLAILSSSAMAVTVDEVPDYTIKIGADYYSMNSNFFDDEHLFAGYPITYTAHLKINGKWFDLLTSTDEQIFGADPGCGVDAVKATVSRTYYNDQKAVYSVTNNLPSELMANAITIPATSSLNIIGGPDTGNISISNWIVKSDNNNVVAGNLSTNPIGQMTIVFNKNIKKTNTNDISIFLNEANTEPANAGTIKQMLFDAFVTTNATTTAANELGTNISLLNYTDLKDLLTTYNNGVPVTKVTIVGQCATDTTTATVILNLE